MVGFLWHLQKIMALYTWGIPYLSIGKDGCSYNAPHAYRLLLGLLPTTSRPTVSRLSAMTCSGWRHGFCLACRSLSSFWPPHLLPNVHPLMIHSEWNKLDTSVLLQCHRHTYFSCSFQGPCYLKFSLYQRHKSSLTAPGLLAAIKDPSNLSMAIYHVSEVVICQIYQYSLSRRQGW